MGFIKSALGMIKNAATGGLASGIGGIIGGLFGGGTSVKDQKKIMAEYKYSRFCFDVYSYRSIVFGSSAGR